MSIVGLLKPACVAVLASLLCCSGCCWWGHRFVDRGQEAPSFDVDELIAKNKLSEVLEGRLDAVRTLRAYGIDMSYDSPEESHTADVALFLRPPGRARAIISKGIIGVIAEIVVEGKKVIVYMPRESKVKIIHLRSEDFSSLRILTSSAVWGLYAPGAAPKIGPGVKPVVADDEVIVTLPLHEGRGHQQRLTFDRKTLLLRSRVIVPEEGAPLARAEFSRWRQFGDVWWPRRTSLRLPRNDVDCELTFSQKPDRTRPNAAIPDEVFELDLPDDVIVEHEWYPEM